MAAAPFVFHNCRRYIKKIHQPQAVDQYIRCFYSQMDSEKFIKIRRTPAEKKDFAFIIQLHVFRKLTPSIGYHVRRCHGPHHRLKKTAVRLMGIPVFLVFNQGADITDKIREINTGRTPIIAKTTGQAGPDIFFNFF